MLWWWLHASVCWLGLAYSQWHSYIECLHQMDSAWFEDCLSQTWSHLQSTAILVYARLDEHAQQTNTRMASAAHFPCVLKYLLGTTKTIVVREWISDQRMICMKRRYERIGHYQHSCHWQAESSTQNQATKHSLSAKQCSIDIRDEVSLQLLDILVTRALGRSIGNVIFVQIVEVLSRWDALLYWLNLSMNISRFGDRHERTLLEQNWYSEKQCL